MGIDWVEWDGVEWVGVFTVHQIAFQPRLHISAVSDTSDSSIAMKRMTILSIA